MEVDNELPRINDGESTKDKTGVVEGLLAWFKTLLKDIGVSSLISLSSLITAILAGIVASCHFEAAALMKQISENRTAYESALSEMQSKLEERIPERVRSPLPIFPKNDVSLVLGSTEKEAILELEWADRDRKHRHQYLVQVVCIAEIPRRESSKHHAEELAKKAPEKVHCDANNLETDTLDGEYLRSTQPGVESVAVPIKDAGTYAWRVARGESDGNGNKTIFEEWSPYFIFTVFESIESRVKVTDEALVGIVEGSALHLQEKRANAKGEENAGGGSDVASREQVLVNSIQREQFEGRPARYRFYPTYEALIEGVIRGELDYAIGELTRTTDREQRGVYFTRGYHNASPIVIAKSSTKRTRLDGGAIGVISGSATDQALTRLAESRQFTIVRELLPSDLIKDLKKNTVDFIFSANELVKNLVDQNESKEFDIAGEPDSELKEFYERRLGYPPEFAIATANESLCKEFDKQVEREIAKSDLFLSKTQPCIPK